MTYAGGTERPQETAKPAAIQRRRRLAIFAALLAAGLLAGGGYWLATKDSQSTDDAFVEADVVQIAPQVGGVVAALHFTDNQWVEQGQLLIEIDPRDYAVQKSAAEAALAVAVAQQQAADADFRLTRVTTGAAVDQARHALEQAHHQVAQARQETEAAAADAERTAADVQRYRDLVQRGDASRQRYEQAVADQKSTQARWRAAQLAAIAAQAQEAQAVARLDDALAVDPRLAQKAAQLANAAAQVDQARASLAAAELNLSYTRLFAAQSGRVSRRAVSQGDVVQKNQALAALVVDHPWVVANFKETQLTRMRPGQPAKVVVDAFPGQPLSGHVDSVQAGTGSRFSLLPAENATGNYVKVVQRLPVKIVFDSLPDDVARRLAPGMSVVPVVDVGATPAAAPPAAAPPQQSAR